jgi:hypothetical protein
VLFGHHGVTWRRVGKRDGIKQRSARKLTKTQSIVNIRDMRYMRCRPRLLSSSSGREAGFEVEVGSRQGEGGKGQLELR